MRYSPCGMGVDLIKYPYEAPCRFIDDPDAPTSVVRWTPIRPGAEMLPFPSIIHNLVMDPEPTRWDLPVGEQWTGYGRSATWVTTPPAITGKRFCGLPSDFFDGSVYDTSPPLAVYGANKWLLCCAQAPVAFGGAGAGGIGVPIFVRPIKVYGAAGASGLIRPHVLTPGTVGGGRGGGGPLQFQIRPVGVPAGGGRAGGVLAFQLTPSSAPTGGGRAGGVLAFQLTPSSAPSGGGRAGGPLAFQIRPAAAPLGGGRGGGTLAFQIRPAAAPLGGGRGGGTLNLRVSPVGAPTGGGRGGGGLAHVADLVSGRVQYVGAHGSLSLSAQATWPAATTKGNLLVAVLATYGNGGTTPTSNAPWVTALSELLFTHMVWIYYLDQSASRSGTETFTLSGSPTGIYPFWSLHLAEYTQLRPVRSVANNTAQVNNATVSPSCTVTPAEIGDLVVAGLCANGSTVGETFSSPTNGFSLVGQTTESNGGDGLSGVYLDLLQTTSTAAIGTQATCSATFQACRNGTAIFK